MALSTPQINLPPPIAPGLNLNQAVDEILRNDGSSRANKRTRKRRDQRKRQKFRDRQLLGQSSDSNQSHSAMSAPTVSMRININQQTSYPF